MDETNDNNTQQPKKGLSKKVFIIVIGLLVIAGGTVAAFMIFQPSDKEKYFLAEKETADHLSDAMQKRYEPETLWKEQKEDNATKTVMDFSIEYNDPFGAGSGFMNPEEIINNSSLTLDYEMDRDEKKMATELRASFAGMEMDGFHFFLTENEMMSQLPFLDDVLQIKADDLPALLHEMAPEAFTGNEEYDFNTFFEGLDAIKEEMNTEHFKEEYLDMLYESLPDESFDIEKENVNVQNEDVKTERITFDLSEEELKDLLKRTLRTMQQDETLKELIKDQMKLQFAGDAANLDPALESEIQMMVDQLDEGLEMLEEGVDNIAIPDGMTSTLWVNDDIIVKRDFSLEIGPEKNNTVNVSVEGEQLLGDKRQQFDYTLAMSDSIQEIGLSLKGDMDATDDAIDDSVKLESEGFEVTYDGDESLEGDTRDYERVFSFEDASGSKGSLIWDGEASYDNDKMESSNEFSMEAPDMSQDMFKLIIAKDAKTIKEVELPEDSDKKNIGNMNLMELNNYFETEVAPKAEEWLYQIVGGGMGGF